MGRLTSKDLYIGFKQGDDRGHFGIGGGEMPAVLRWFTRPAMPSTYAAACALVMAMMISESWNYEVIGPGCHVHPFNVTIKSDHRGTCRGTHVIYACVGYCESSAFPSKYSVLQASNFKHNITSVSQCCTITKKQKIKVHLNCPIPRREEVEIFTAKACQCDMCRLSRY